MKVLVTGGGGFIGMRVCERLRKRGYGVRSLARGDYPELRARGVDTRRGDIQDFATVSAAMQGVDAVMHVAARPGVWGSKQSFFGPNLEGTKNVVEAVREHGIRRLVFTSSPSVVFSDTPHEGADERLPYPEKHRQHYSASKAAAERVVLGANEPGRLHTVALRPHLVWGPGDPNLIPRVIDRARRGRLVQVGDGRNQVSICHIENAASAHVAALEAIARPGPACGCAYFINDAQPVYLWDFIRALLARLELPPVKRSIKLSTALRIGGILEFTYRALEIEREPPMTRFVAQQLGTSHWYRTDRARDDLGWLPEMSHDQGFNDLVNHLIAQDQKPPSEFAQPSGPVPSP